MQKSKRKEVLTPAQELSESLATKLISKIVVVKGRLCLRGQESNPIAMLARGEPGIGQPPAHRWNDTQIQFQNPDGTWGVLVDLKGGKGDIGKGTPGKPF